MCLDKVTGKIVLKRAKVVKKLLIRDYENNKYYHGNRRSEMRIKDAKEGMRVRVCTSKEFSKRYKKYPKRYRKYPYWVNEMFDFINKTGIIIDTESSESIRKSYKEYKGQNGIIIIKVPQDNETWSFFAQDINPI